MFSGHATCLCHLWKQCNRYRQGYPEASNTHCWLDWYIKNWKSPEETSPVMICNNNVPSCTVKTMLILTLQRIHQSYNYVSNQIVSTNVKHFLVGNVIRDTCCKGEGNTSMTTTIPIGLLLYIINRWWLLHRAIHNNRGTTEPKWSTPLILSLKVGHLISHWVKLNGPFKLLIVKV